MKLESTREGFGQAMLELGENPKVVVVDADLAGSLKVEEFAREYPERFFECGVAEQNAVGVAAGLALEGFIPFVTSFACFSPGINFNVIRQSVCLSGANVKIVSSHGGLMTGADGASHQALEDLALMRVLPGMVVLVPADFEQAKGLTKLAAEYKGPVYLRLARPETRGLQRCRDAEMHRYRVGGSEVLREGRELTIVSCGPIITEVMEAISLIGQIGQIGKTGVELINAYSVKPLDKATILRSVAKTGKVLTVEDHSVIGGLGAAVAELLAERYPLPVKILGVPDVFGESARDWQELLGKYKLDSKGLRETIWKLIYQK